MKTEYNEEEKYYQAKKRVENLKGFYYNVLSYCLVIPFLIFINLWTSPDHYWFWYPMIGWGIGLCFHGFGVYNHKFGFGKEWEEKKIKEYMDRYDDTY